MCFGEELFNMFPSKVKFMFKANMLLIVMEYGISHHRFISRQ